MIVKFEMRVGVEEVGQVTQKGFQDCSESGGHFAFDARVEALFLENEDQFAEELTELGEENPVDMLVLLFKNEKVEVTKNADFLFLHGDASLALVLVFADEVLYLIRQTEKDLRQELFLDVVIDHVQCLDQLDHVQQILEVLAQVEKVHQFEASVRNDFKDVVADYVLNQQRRRVVAVLFQNVRHRFNEDFVVVHLGSVGLLFAIFCKFPIDKLHRPETPSIDANAPPW